MRGSQTAERASKALKLNHVTTFDRRDPRAFEAFKDLTSTASHHITPAAASFFNYFLSFPLITSHSDSGIFEGFGSQNSFTLVQIRPSDAPDTVPFLLTRFRPLGEPWRLLFEYHDPRIRRVTRPPSSRPGLAANQTNCSRETRLDHPSQDALVRTYNRLFHSPSRSPCITDFLLTNTPEPRSFGPATLRLVTTQSISRLKSCCLSMDRELGALASTGKTHVLCLC